MCACLQRYLYDLGDGLEWAVGIGTIIFLVQYSLYAKWWRNVLGRSIVLLDLAILGVVGPSVVMLADPKGMASFVLGVGYAFIEVGVLAIATYAVISRIWFWEKTRRARGFKNGGNK